MNAKELAFCGHYALHRNAEQAALAAGYSPTHARKSAHLILSRPHIQEQLNWLSEKAQDLVALDAVVVLNHLGAVALTWPGELLKKVDGRWVGKSPEELTPQQKAAVKKIRVKTTTNDAGESYQEYSYEMHEKLPALFKLGEHFGVGDAVTPGSKSNPFEGMEQGQLDEIRHVMEKAMHPKLVEVK